MIGGFRGRGKIAAAPVEVEDVRTDPRRKPPRPVGARRVDGTGYFAATGDLHVSLVLILPLLAAYQIGVLLVDLRVLNGVDFVTRYVFSNHGLRGVVLLNLVVVAVFLAAIIRLQHQGRFRVGLFPPLLAESALYAWFLSGLIALVANRVAGAGVPSAEIASSLRSSLGEALQNAVLSIGAGVYEELVFRLLLIWVLEYVFRDLVELGRRPALVLAVLFSSALFAAAHYVGPYGDPFALGTFLFRAGAGIAFSVIYKARSFAVCVYAHALYDVYVLVL